MHGKIIQAAFAIAALTFAGASWADGPDELWEVTTKTEMPGMPMAMPAHTLQMCKKKNRKIEEDLAPGNRPCKVADVKKSGTRVTFSIVCEGKEGFKANGEHELLGPDNFRTIMHMEMGKKGMSMNVVSNAKRVGSCTAKS